MNQRFEKIKVHIRDNGRMYVGIGITFVVTAGITTVIMRESHAVLQGGAGCPVKEPMDSLSLLSGRSIFGSITNNAVTTIHKTTKGNPGFVTRCIETKDLFETQGGAARAFGIPEPIMSQHLNFGRELIEGIHFERVGVFCD
jgi:hypothetical protein